MIRRITDAGIIIIGRSDDRATGNDKHGCEERFMRCVIVGKNRGVARLFSLGTWAVAAGQLVARGWQGYFIHKDLGFLSSEVQAC